MMDVAAPVITPVVDSIMKVIKQHMGYLFFSTRNVNEMRTNMAALNVMATDMKRKKEINGANRLVEPASLPGWLEDVEKIYAEVGNMATDGIGCFNMKARYKAGKKSSDILEAIEKLKKKESEIKWTGEKWPLARIRSTMPSTSESVDTQSVIIKSRELIFDKALKALEPDNKCQLMALCGVGGVGKSTMMEQLKKVVVDDRKFNYVVTVVIGESKTRIMIQDAVADNIGDPLTEKDPEQRAKCLSEKFKSISEDGKKKILVILDDIWKKMDLEDIGLMIPLPKGFKLLLTARDKRVCTQMGVEPSCIFSIVPLKELEAQDLFWKIAGIVSDSDHDLITIGEDIVKKCGGLPIAIKIIASTLRDNKDKETWKDTHILFQNNSVDLLDNIFEISYNNLKDDDEKAIFLLSGLFPDDHNIHKEDLTRYGWGLELFKNSNSISEARCRVNACVINLIRSNLFVESDRKGCVKIHDLVRDFTLSEFSVVKQASFVNNDNISDQLRKDSYERLLLKCGDMVEFPADFNRRNLALLSLMDGEKLNKFPEDFYTRMEKLQVVSYAGIRKPLFPHQLTTLRTLCLDSCKSLDDISYLGDLISLEVLSLAFCDISNLPSAIGNLKNLKLLDLTGCVDLCIDDGVFQSLHKLAELYMRARYENPIKFTEDSCQGLKMVSSKLIALEIEFFNNLLQPKNVSFKKLERFRISVGAQFKTRELERFLSENTLKLVGSCEEIVEGKTNELFVKTEELELTVNGMSSLEEFTEHNTFSKLKILNIDDCADLTFLFTVNVASGLRKLESLTVSRCPFLKSLVKSENHGAKVITFHKLKFLTLRNLPEFVGLCDGDEVMDLPQLLKLSLTSLPFETCIFSENNEISTTTLLLNTEVLIPKLERLEISEMEKLKEIWCDNTASNSSSSSLEEVDNISTLREIKVIECNSVVNLFPRNPMRLLTHLQTLEVRHCSSIEVLFNIDLQQGCVGQITENVSGSSSLRSIKVDHLANLREVWRIKGGDDNNSGSGIIIIREFQGVELLEIMNCGKMRSIFTPTTIYFDMGALKTIQVWNRRSWGTTDGQKQQVICEVAIPSSLLHTSNQLPDITLRNLDVEVVFDMKSTQSSSSDLVTTTNPNQLRPCTLHLSHMKHMTHLWRCNWNASLVFQNQHPISLFHNITTIRLTFCDRVKYLFSPLMATLLSNLKVVAINYCLYMEEVVSNRDDEDENEKMITTTTLFPNLDVLILDMLPFLKHVGGGVAKGTTNIIHDQLKVPELGVVYWSLCLYSRKIRIKACNALSSVIPSCTAGQRIKVEVMLIENCKSMKEVFSSAVENDNGCQYGTISDQESGAVNTSVSIPRHGNITSAHKLSNLKTLHIIECDSLEYIFTFSTLESLKNLKEIRIRDCKEIKVIVREEEEGGDQTTTPNVVVFPCLKVIELAGLSNLQGFFLGIKEFQWRVLDDVCIHECPKMNVFTCSKSMAPRLEYVKHPIFGKLSPQYYNIYKTAASLQIPSPSLDSTSSISNDQEPRSLRDINEINVEDACRCEVIIASNELLHLQNLEKIHAKWCESVQKIFEVELEATGSEFNNKSQLTVVKLPKLREVVLEELDSLKYLWKNNKWRQLELPNLTRLSIHDCDSLEHVFTTSMVGSLMQLQELHVTGSFNVREIVEEDDDSETKVLPCLKSLKLEDLQRLKGFCFWKKDLLFPSLNTLVIKECSKLSVFTKGFVAAPELKVIETDEGFIDVGEQDINSLIITHEQEENNSDLGHSTEGESTDDE